MMYGMKSGECNIRSRVQFALCVAIVSHLFIREKKINLIQSKCKKISNTEIVDQLISFIYIATLIRSITP